MSVQIGTVKTFKDVKADKEQAVKVLEEAGEVVDAFKAYREAALTDWTEPDNANEYRMACDHLINECADVLQATCNLLSALNVVDMTKWIERCKAKNERRGREYERDLEPSVQVTEVGKTSAISRQSDGMDSREKLEAAVQTAAGYIYGRGFTNGLADAWNDDEVDTAANQIIQLLDRQAAITEREVKERVNFSIITQMANALLPDYQARVAELQRQLDTMRDVTRELRDERDMWRDKCGKMLDIAHEITRLGDVE